jgi:hypothetical protein
MHVLWCRSSGVSRNPAICLVRNTLRERLLAVYNQAERELDDTNSSFSDNFLNSSTRNYKKIRSSLVREGIILIAEIL